MFRIRVGFFERLQDKAMAIPTRDAMELGLFGL